MAWVKIDDTCYMHRKVVAAGNEAFGAFARALAWSSHHLTDGLLPKDVAKTFAGDDVWRRLLDVGMLHDDGTNYIIHDFLEYNPSADSVRKTRKERAKAGSKGGKQSSTKRTSKRQANCLDGASPVASTLRKQNSTPYPTRTHIESTYVDSLAPSCADAPSEPQVLPATTVITITLNDKSEHPVTQTDVNEWAGAYPAVDVLQELRNIRQWNLSNPRKRKTRSGIRNHITAWLADKQNKSHGANGQRYFPVADKKSQSLIEMAAYTLQQNAIAEAIDGQ